MKILYLMHIPWGWIKQRPHFFAEKLAQDYCIDVYYLRSVRKSISDNSETNRVAPKPVYLPFALNEMIISKLGDQIYSYIFKRQIPNLSNYTHIWITNLWLYRYLKKYISDNQILIYDCMDDDFGFPIYDQKNKLKDKMKEIEIELISRANYILFSSNHLMHKVISRVKSIDKDKFKVVNNGIELFNHDINPLNEYSQEIIDKINFVKSLQNPIAYIGTIASWLDFNLLINLLNREKDINIIMFGPSEVSLPKHERLHHLGSIERKYVSDFMKLSKILIMPFIVNDLIRSVNPVKLYEYIYACKPIVVPYYDELKQFLPFIETYKNEENFYTIVHDILQGSNLKYSENDSKEFICANTWDKRYLSIKNFALVGETK